MEAQFSTLLTRELQLSAACYLPTVSTNDVWQTFVQGWASIYTGLPNRILTDQGSQFGDRFIQSARLAGVGVTRTGIEAHASLGLGERYHEPLRSTFRSIMKSRPDVDKELALSLSVKVMTNTLGPKGLVPSALVFGEFPQIRHKSEVRTERPHLDKRSEVAQLAREEISNHMAQLLVKRALHHAVPPSCDRSYEPGDEVLV